MKHLSPILLLALLLAAGCTSQKKLAYLNNLSETGGEETFTMDIPDYKLQPRDNLYITAKITTPDGSVKDLLSAGSSAGGSQDMSGGYLIGYIVDSDGNILLPPIGTIKVGNLTIGEVRKMIQISIDSVFKNSIVDCKLQGFKVTILGEVNNPGTSINYTNYLTVLEAIGRAGGINDQGDRNGILIIRMTDKVTKTFRINLQDKQILSSEAYFLHPNDVVIVKPTSQKILERNTPTISFMLALLSSTISTTLLLIFFLK